MPNNAPLNFKERSVRRAIRAVHKEDLAVERIEIARDGTISVITALRPKLDLTNEIESLGLEVRMGRPPHDRPQINLRSFRRSLRMKDEGQMGVET